MVCMNEAVEMTNTLKKLSASFSFLQVLRFTNIIKPLVTT